MKELQLNFILNMTTVRWLQILNLFERERVCSLAEISKTLLVSRRTIISDLKKIREYFPNQIEITVEGNGYHFTEKQPQQYLLKKRELLAEEELFQIVENIFYGELKSVEDWALQFFVSESTMRRYLLTVLPTLEKYELTWTFQPVNLQGEEINIRKFFKDFYYESDITPHSVIPPEELMVLITENFSQEHLGIRSGASPGDFLYDLYITLERIRQGKMVQIPQMLQEVVHSISEWSLILQVKKRVENFADVKLNQEEVTWLYLLTMTKRTIDKPEQERLFCEQFNLWPEFRQISQEFVSFLNLPFKDLEQAYMFFQSFFISKKLNECLSPTLNRVMTEVKEEIQSSDEGTFNQVQSFLKEQQPILNFSESYLLDISVALTYYCEAIKEQYCRIGKNIAFILEGNIHVCQGIRARALRYVGHVQNVFFPTINELTDEFLREHQINLVVTNYSEHLNAYILETDYLLFKAIPDNHDWNNLIKKINPRFARAFLLEKNTV